MPNVYGYDYDTSKPKPPLPGVQLPTLDPSAEVSVLIGKLKDLAKKLQYVQAGKDLYETAYDKWEGVQVFGRKTTRGHIESGYFITKKQGYVYSEDDCLVLEGQIHKLIVAIGQMRGPDTDAKRVLMATAHAIMYPSRENHRKLSQIANEVQGHGNQWAQVRMALTTIVLLLAGVIPGLIYASCIFEKDSYTNQSAWSKHSRQGLSAETDAMAEAIVKTTAPQRIAKHSFFTEPRRVKEAAAPVVTNASTPPASAPLVPGDGEGEEPQAPLLKS